ncbi:MAG: phosphate transport system regulatory protein PhoU [Methanobrevibacter sp.]|jgi:phosphate transport system protein|nr:phosphate transport system regulatory protein PhoU [Candidatus Methanovirga procula]
MSSEYPSTIFKKRINKIKNSIEELGIKTIEANRKTVSLLNDYNDEIAKEATDQGNEIDELAFELEKNCIKFIAIEQPLAGDLMFVESTIRVSNHLGRIGILISKIARELKPVQDMKLPEKLLENCQYMGSYVQMMLSKSINAFLDRNKLMASELKEDDLKVDDLFDSILIQVTDLMSSNPEYIKMVTKLIFIVRYLERIGDRAVDIGIRTKFMLTFKQ